MEDTIHTEDNNYTQNDDIETLQQISTSLHRIMEEHGGDPEKSGVRDNKDGSYTVFIDENRVEYWFKDEVELASWILGVNHSD